MKKSIIYKDFIQKSIFEEVENLFQRNDEKSGSVLSNTLGISKAALGLRVRVFIAVVVVGVFSPTTIFSQNNRISIQTGLFHSFFDESPILNVNYPNNGKLLKGVLYSSFGVQYLRKIGTKNYLSVEYQYYYKHYWNVHPNLLKNVVAQRSYNTFNITYERALSLKHNFTFTYGGGINYRKGNELIAESYGYFSGWGYHSNFESRKVSDWGLNIRTGIEYSPLKWLTLYTKFDLIGFLYLHDKEQIERIKSYGYKNYPHRFDLSWRFGIGFNFGNGKNKKESGIE